MNREIMNRFAFAPTDVSISRSTFPLSHSVKFSFNVGEIIPFYVNPDILPGDTFQIQTSKVVRLQPLVSPIMDNLYLDTMYFFVPNRLIWEHWKEFMGENNSTYWTQPVEYNVPHLNLNAAVGEKTILDYMGIPVGVYGSDLSINALPLRAYALIWNDWFRSEDVTQPVSVPVNDTDVNIGTANTSPTFAQRITDSYKGNISPLLACKYFDYFTSSLPSPQKGPAVTFDLAGSAPVYSGKRTVWTTASDGVLTYDPSKHGAMKMFSFTSGSSGTLSPLGDRTLGMKHIDTSSQGTLDATTGGVDIGSVAATASTYAGNGFIPANLWADLSTVSQFSINELRTAFAIQKFYERQALGGSRYIEMIKSFFHVDSSDARMQRSEYLGGSRLPLNVSQVEQTSATESGLTPLGDVAGMSVTGDVNGDFIKSFEEHGVLIGVAVVRYNHTYQQGIGRQWFRRTLFDYYFPTFANVGERATFNKELYATGSSTDDQVFGYNEAWAEYRYTPSRVAGEMRSDSTTPLDYWHLADDYSSLPTLTSDWIFEDKAPLDRCLAVTSSVSNQLIADFYLDIKATRPMPAYSIPGLIDHH